MKIDIEGKIISKNSPTFIIAKIEANSNNNVEDIKKIIDKAKECGVDTVKFHTYTPQELLAGKDRIITWGEKGQEKTQTISELFDEVKFDRSLHKENMLSDLLEFIKNVDLVKRMAFNTWNLIDGKASERIAEYIRHI